MGKRSRTLQGSKTHISKLPPPVGSGSALGSSPLLLEALDQELADLEGAVPCSCVQGRSRPGAATARIDHIKKWFG